MLPCLPSACFLQKLQPDVVITQSLCHVCSVNYCLVERLTAQMEPQPRLLDLNPQVLQGDQGSH